MSEESDASVVSQPLVKVIGELPYYVPVPENVVLTPRIDMEPFTLEFQHFQPAQHADSPSGRAVDDRRGTYIKSRVHVVFPVSTLPSSDELRSYAEKALRIANRALLSVKYVAFDPAVHHVDQFDRCEVHAWAEASDKSKDPNGVFTQSISFGPFGLTLQATLTRKALDRLWWVFNDLDPLNPAWLLVLDAKYHNAVGDLPRAILDLGTALEIHIGNLIATYCGARPAVTGLEIEGRSVYQVYDSILRQATGHSMHERPDLFVKLEYIRGLRNSITHKWKPEFQVTQRMKKHSRYLDEHLKRDGHVVKSQEEVLALIEDTIEMLQYASELFNARYTG